jgi:hypothetical protein
VSSPVAQHFLRNHFDDRESQFRRKISNQQKRKSNQRKRKRVLLEHGLLTRGERLHRRNIDSQSYNSFEEDNDDKQYPIWSSNRWRAFHPGGQMYHGKVH